MANGTYLRWRPQGWVFRRAIPQDLQERWGQKEIVRSLGGVAQNRAAYESRALGVACEELFMQARANPALTSAELRNFANAFGASARDAWRDEPLRRAGGTWRETYENHRDVATTAMAAACEGRALFDPAKVVQWAEDAGIPAASAVANMPLLQQAVARGTAGYCLAIATELRPSLRPRSRLKSWLFGPPDDYGEETFEAVREAYGRLGPLVDAATAARSAGGGDPVDPLEEATTAALANSPIDAPGIEHKDDAEVREVEVGSGAHVLEPSIQAGQHAAELPPLVRAEPLSARGTPDEATRESPTASSDEALSATTPPSHSSWDGRLSSIYDEFVDDQIKNGIWSRSRRPELASTRNLFLRIVGDVSLFHLTRDKVKDFRTRFLALPTDHKNMWTFVDARGVKVERTYDEMIAHAKATIGTGAAAFQTLNAKTWNKHCCNLGAFMEWARTTKEAAKDLENVFRKLHLPVAKDAVAIRLERSMAPTVALKALLKTEIWTGRRSAYHLTGRGHIIIRDSLYWVPLMEVTEGMRREECCQLRVKHVITRLGVLCFDLFASDLRVKADKGSSRRLVPLSQALIDLGFIDAVVTGRDKNELLFPELDNGNAHQAYGSSFGKRFLNYVANVTPDFSAEAERACAGLPVSDSERMDLIKQESERLLTDFREKMSNHALRHWFKTEAENADCKTNFLEELMGHAHPEQKTEGSRYFKQAYLHNLKKTIDKIPMPFDPRELRRMAETYEAADEARQKSSRDRKPARRCTTAANAP